MGDTPKRTETVTEPAKSTTAAAPAHSERTYDPRVMVNVYNTETKTKLDRPVPETWLDGRFPQLSETPSSKKGD